MKARAGMESESTGTATYTLPTTRDEARLQWRCAQEEQAHDKGPTNLRLRAKRASMDFKSDAPANRAVFARSHPLLDGHTEKDLVRVPI